MNIQAYIESGILEDYVLGLLSDKEAEEVSAYLSKHPQLKVEKESIEDTLYNYSLSFKKLVPKNIEASILSKIKEQSLTPNALTGEVPPSSSIVNYLISSFFLVSTLLLIYLSFDSYTKSNEIKALDQNFITLHKECDAKDQSIYGLKEELRILKDENNIQVKMKGTDKAPQAIANIIYNSKSKASYLDVLSLPKPPAGKQYQLWAIVDGKPVDMGVFDIIFDDHSTLQKVPFIEKPQAFAVTLEQKGGNPTPTLEEMYVIGYITG